MSNRLEELFNIIKKTPYGENYNEDEKNRKINKEITDVLSSSLNFSIKKELTAKFPKEKIEDSFLEATTIIASFVQDVINLKKINKKSVISMILLSQLIVSSVNKTVNDESILDKNKDFFEKIHPRVLTKFNIPKTSNLFNPIDSLPNSANNNFNLKLKYKGENIGGVINMISRKEYEIDKDKLDKIKDSIFFEFEKIIIPDKWFKDVPEEIIKKN